MGIMWMMSSTLVWAAQDGGFQQSFPPWTYFFASFTVFMYQTFDACDGKQARRTGASSPLGQLFDHGCDALNSILAVYLSC